MKMAVEVRNLFLSIKINPVDRQAVNQIIRCSSSVAANYRSATCGRSDAEFFSKICIVVEETDETKFWLDYLVSIKLLDEQAIKGLRNEVDELVRLFSTIRKRMREKLGKIK